MLGIGTVFLFTSLFTGIKGKLDRWEAAALLVMYVAYTAYLVSKEFPVEGVVLKKVLF